jgi:hypothetical protein
VSLQEEEEEGLHGVFKRLRCNGHQLEKGCCEKLSSDCHSKRGWTPENSPCVRGMIFVVKAQTVFLITRNVVVSDSI